MTRTPLLGPPCPECNRNTDGLFSDRIGSSHGTFWICRRCDHKWPRPSRGPATVHTPEDRP